MIFLEDSININLVEDTVIALEKYGKTPKDVVLITFKQDKGNKRIGFDWDQFTAVADNVYYNGFGSQDLNHSLKIIGSDWWMSRHEYDGKESWIFNTIQKKFIQINLLNRTIYLQKDLIKVQQKKGSGEMTTEAEKKQSLEEFNESLHTASRKLARVADFYGFKGSEFYEILETFNVICELVEAKTRPGIVLETCGGAMH